MRAGYSSSARGLVQTWTRRDGVLVVEDACSVFGTAYSHWRCRGLARAHVRARLKIGGETKTGGRARGMEVRPAG